MYFSRILIHHDFFRTAQQEQNIYKNFCYGTHKLLWKLFTNENHRNFIYREEIARQQFGTQFGVRGEPVYYLVSNSKPSSENTFFQVQYKEYKPKLSQGNRLQFNLRANPVITRNGRKHDVVMDTQLVFLKSLCEKLNLQTHLSSTPKKKEFKKVLLLFGGKALDEYLTDFFQDDFRYAERLQHSIQLQDKLELSIKAVIDVALEQWLFKRAAYHGFEICKDNNKYRQGCALQNSGYRWHSLEGKAGKRVKSGFSSVDFTGELEVTDVDKFISALFKGIGRSKAFGCGLMLVKRTR